MPNIEIISVRLNLDKDDDRKLFEKLQKRMNKASLSRNEFLKRLLLESLSGHPATGTTAAPNGPRRGRPAGRKKPDSNAAIEERNERQGQVDTEAASLVASFVN